MPVNFSKEQLNEVVNLIKTIRTAVVSGVGVLILTQLGFVDALKLILKFIS